MGRGPQRGRARTRFTYAGFPHRFHRHFASDVIHRDGGPECDQPGTPRRVYVFDPDVLSEHELNVARYAVAHPEEFAEDKGDEAP